MTTVSTSKHKSDPSSSDEYKALDASIRLTSGASEARVSAAENLQLAEGELLTAFHNFAEVSVLINSANAVAAAQEAFELTCDIEAAERDAQDEIDRQEYATHIAWMAGMYREGYSSIHDVYELINPEYRDCVVEVLDGAKRFNRIVKGSPDADFSIKAFIEFIGEDPNDHIGFIDEWKHG